MYFEPWGVQKTELDSLKLHFIKPAEPRRFSPVTTSASWSTVHVINSLKYGSEFLAVCFSSSRQKSLNYSYKCALAAASLKIHNSYHLNSTK